jgi:hypothetical protein
MATNAAGLRSTLWICCKGCATREARLLWLCAFLPPALLVVLAPVTRALGTGADVTVAVFYGFAIVACYLKALFYLNQLMESHAGHETESFIGFGAGTVILLLQFAAGWYTFGFFQPSSLATGQTYLPTLTDAVYFSAITLTTVGYGDYLPSNTAGKMLAAIQVVTGTMHMVAFLALMMNAKGASDASK